MSPLINNPDNYNEIRQIIMDAIDPLKEQLDRIYESLKDEYARKDVVDPQLESLRNDLKELKNQSITAPQRYLVFVSALVGLLITLLNLFSHVSIK